MVLFLAFSLFLATSEVVHCMIYPKNCAKDKVENSEWQNSLPETNEMESKRNTTEDFVTLNSTDDLSRSWFGLENRKNARTYTIEHTCIDIVRGYGGKTNLRLHLLQLDTHRVAPTNNGPFAGTINRHLRVGQHAAR